MAIPIPNSAYYVADGACGVGRATGGEEMPDLRDRFLVNIKSFDMC